MEELLFRSLLKLNTKGLRHELSEDGGLNKYIGENKTGECKDDF